MPRPNPRAPGPEQEAMFSEPDRVDARYYGRHSKAAELALAEAKAHGSMAAVDEALAATIRASMWALDEFEARKLPYGPAKLVSPLLEALNAAHMTPEARREVEANTANEIQELLNAMASPATVRDAS